MRSRVTGTDFGATGMVGQGVLRECLRDAGVESVLAIGRSSTGRTHPKLREMVLQDLFDFAAATGHLQGYDVCFFCLGVSAAGMSEAAYTRITFDLTLGWNHLSNKENSCNMNHKHKDHPISTAVEFW
jgi:putative NADH-flavin reductase